MQPHQWQWGISQWVEYLKDKEIPVLPATRAVLQTLREAPEEERERLSARDMADIVYADPYLALKILRKAEERRSRQLGHDTTTPLAAILQVGFDEMHEIVVDSPLSENVLPGCATCEFRSILAAAIARAWADLRADISSDEVAMAALLVEVGELLLWHCAPEMTDKEVRVREWNERYWALAVRPSEIEFTFRQLSMALAQAWGLPGLIVALIKGTDTPRANIARLAADAAKQITLEPEVPGLLAILQEVQGVVPGNDLAELAVPLPLPEPLRDALLAAIAALPPAA